MTLRPTRRQLLIGAAAIGLAPTVTMGAAHAAPQQIHAVGQLGRALTFHDPHTGRPLVDLVVHALRPTACGHDQQHTADYGRFVVAEMTATTYADPNELLEFVWLDLPWRYRTGEEVTFAWGAQSESCGQEAPMLEPHSTYRHDALLDVPAGPTTLVYSATLSYPGWEFSIP